MKALKTLAHDLYVDVPVINSIFKATRYRSTRKCCATIMSKGHRNIGILGLSFKAGTDDLRCSLLSWMW